MISIWTKRTLIPIIFIIIGTATFQTKLDASENITHQQLERAFTAFQQGCYDKAIRLWQNLADQGIASAKINLAAMYDSGKGVAADPEKAAILYRDVAAGGDKYAQYNLAVMHIEGRGVPQDFPIASKWLQKAAAQKMALAQYKLGLLYAGVYQVSGNNDPLSESNNFLSNEDRALHFIYESGLGFEQETDADGLQKTIKAMEHLAPGDPRIDTLRAKFDTLQNSVGADTNQQSLKTAYGTAWPLENGHVVTNYHVIAGSQELALQTTNGQRLKAWPVLYDQASDLALLAVADTSLLPPGLPLCSADAPLGSPVFTLGFPRVDILGFTPKYTAGIIENDRGPLGNADRYLTTVDIQPGNSGGPLLNSSGEVVGVVTAMIGERDENTGALQVLPNQSCAVKTANIKQLVELLPKNEQSHHTIAGKDRSIQKLREQLKNCILVVIAHEKS